MTFNLGQIPTVGPTDGGDFWTELVRLGLIQGVPELYSSGSLAPEEYGHALVTALGAAPLGSTEREFLVNMMFRTGAVTGDPNWWINNTPGAEDLKNWRDAATRQFSIQPQVTIPPDLLVGGGGGFTPGPVSRSPLTPPTAPSVPAIPGVDGPAGGGIDAPSFDYEGAARLIAPWLPAELISVFADAWAKFGDANIALAAVRQDSTYDSFFPGIKRDDGSLRMSEQEYMAQRDAYSILLLEYGINPGIFEGRFTDLIAGDVSASEFAQRLEAAYTQIVTNFDEVRQVYGEFYGIDMTDEAIFASFIDETVGQAILDRRISVAQVGGAAAVQGFGLDANYAERLVNAGLSQQSALAFFGRAANTVPTLQRLATRFNDPDSSVDVTEFAEFGVFQDPTQTQRFRRLFAAESSSFTQQEFARFSEGGSISGLEQR